MTERLTEQSLCLAMELSAPQGGTLVALSAALMVIGAIGVIVPILPGLLLCLAGVLVWTYFGDHGDIGWIVFGACAAWFVVGTVVKYALAGSRAKRDGVPSRTLLVAGLAGLAGMFLIPIAGLFVGFVAGVWLMEANRLGSTKQAWPATVVALKAVGLAVAVELVTGALIIGTWLVGMLVVYVG
ncbi:MAG: DUF456 domain-containing protein [Mycobacteriales bacterium]